MNSAITKLFHLSILLAAFLQASMPAHAEQLGRLFFSPEERRDLESGQLKTPSANTAEKPADTPITVNGFVKRSDGKTTAWVNGIPQNETDTPTEARVNPKKSSVERVTVHLADPAKTVNLKVGQTLTPRTGEVREIYQPPAPVPSKSKVPPALAQPAPAADDAPPPQNGLTGLAEKLRGISTSKGSLK